jgi:hypothetical protein
MDWLNKILGRAPAVEQAPADFDPETATLEQLIAENQRLGREQDAIREKRRYLNTFIDNKLTGA